MSKQEPIKCHLRTFLAWYYNNGVYFTTKQLAEHMLSTRGKDCILLAQDIDVTDAQYLGDFLHENAYSDITVDFIIDDGGKTIAMFDLKDWSFSFKLSKHSINKLRKW